jgi:rhomboid protease GluP
MAQWNDNQDDQPRQQAGGQPDPIYGEAQAIPQQQAHRLSLPFAQPRAVWVLLVLNIAIFAVPWLLDLVGVAIRAPASSRYIPGLSPQDYVTPSDFLAIIGMKINAAIAAGEYYRLFTVMFLHAGVIHIGFNAYALYSLGPEAERIYGTVRFLALYFIAGLAGSVTSYAFNPANGVGASGAIFGLIGGLAAFYYVARGVLGEVSRQQLGSLITVIMINLFIGFSSPVIDNTAHIGGLIGGALVGWLLAPRFAIDTRLYPSVVVKQDWPLAWPGALAVLLGLLGLVMVINPPIQ